MRKLEVKDVKKDDGKVDVLQGKFLLKNLQIDPKPVVKIMAVLRRC